MGLISKLGNGLIGLGTGLFAFGIIGTDSKNSLLESRIATTEVQTNTLKSRESKEPKEKYSFDEVTDALGDRYSRLSDDEKEIVEKNFKKGKNYIQFSLQTFAARVYDREKRKIFFKEESSYDRAIWDIKFSDLKKQELNEYLEAFPWMKKLDLEKIDKESNNPDRILVGLCELYKNYDKTLSGLDLQELQAIDLIKEGQGVIDYFSGHIKGYLEDLAEWPAYQKD